MLVSARNEPFSYRADWARARGCVGFFAEARGLETPEPSLCVRASRRRVTLPHTFLNRRTERGRSFGGSRRVGPRSAPERYSRNLPGGTDIRERSERIAFASAASAFVASAASALRLQLSGARAQFLCVGFWVDKKARPSGFERTAVMLFRIAMRGVEHSGIVGNHIAIRLIMLIPFTSMSVHLFSVYHAPLYS